MSVVLGKVVLHITDNQVNAFIEQVLARQDMGLDP